MENIYEGHLPGEYWRKATTVLSQRALLSSPSMIYAALKVLEENYVWPLPSARGLWEAYQELLALAFEDPEFNPVEPSSYPERVEFGFAESEDEELFPSHVYVALDTGYYSAISSIEVGDEQGMISLSADEEIKESLRISQKVLTELPKDIQDKYEKGDLALTRPLLPSEADETGKLHGTVVNIHKQGSPLLKVTYDILEDQVQFDHPPISEN